MSREGKLETDFGIGKISFDGFFKGLGNLINLVSELKEEEIKKEGEIKGLPKNMRGTYGFSVRTLTGKPSIKTFNHVKRARKVPVAVAEEIREPLTDIFDEGGQIIVIAELPGVSEQEIKLEIKDDILELKALSSKIKYVKEVLLPVKVASLPLKTAYKNGLLEIALRKI